MKLFYAPFIFALAGSSLSAQWVINEIHADPAADITGDANGDGTRDSTNDEFVELINNTGVSVDIENWTITDGFGLRHTFSGSTVVADGQVVLVFGGGAVTGTFGGAITQISSEGGLGLNNGGDSVTLSDANSNIIVSYTYGSEGGNNQSITRDPDVTGTDPLVEHSTASGANGSLYSPGTKVDGNPFAGDSLTLIISPDTFSEAAGAAAATGTVSRSGDTSAAITVNLASSDTSEVTVPASVQIPAGQPSATFDVDAVDDGDQDASQTATITASANDLFSGNASVTIEDDEDPVPTISLDADPLSISENGGSSVVTVTISAASPDGYTFDVLNSDSGELTAPASVSIAANETTATFTVNAVNDADVDGAQGVDLTVSDPDGIILFADIRIVVTDDEAFAAPDIVINELRTDNVGTDTQEYLEIFGATPNYDLTRIWLIVVGDRGGSDTSGNIDRAYDLSGSTVNGNYFLIANDGIIGATPDYFAGTNIFENGDTETFLLVTDFTGSINDDLDTDNDGMIDSTPWGSIIDAVSIVEPGEAPGTVGFGYAASLGFTDVLGEGGFVPAHVLRSPNGTGAWVLGPFGSDEVPAIDTPGALNSDEIQPPVGPDPRILSLSIDPTTGEADMVVTGLGTLVWAIERTNDLNNEDPWLVLPGGFTEADNPDGTVTFSFTDTIAPTLSKRFYRIVEAP
ncbi:MAG: lamin tail domain-containing protein [Verrucomicrobiaceae bacterium]